MKSPILDPHSSQFLETAGDPYLRLQLMDQMPAVIPMEFAQEALVVPISRITAVPNMPECVLGLLNQRSRIFWVVDLPRLLKLPVQDPNVQQYNLVIIRVGKMPLGLVVPAVQGVLRFADEAIQTPIGTVAASITPYLRGCIPQEREILLVLDPEAIVHSALLHGEPDAITDF